MWWFDTACFLGDLEFDHWFFSTGFEGEFFFLSFYAKIKFCWFGNLRSKFLKNPFSIKYYSKSNFRFQKLQNLTFYKPKPSNTFLFWHFFSLQNRKILFNLFTHQTPPIRLTYSIVNETRMKGKYATEEKKQQKKRLKSSKIP